MTNELGTGFDTVIIVRTIPDGEFWAMCLAFKDQGVTLKRVGDSFEWRQGYYNEGRLLFRATPCQQGFFLEHLADLFENKVN